MKRTRGDAERNSDDNPIRAVYRHLRSAAKTDRRAQSDLAYLVHFLENSIDDPSLQQIVQDYRSELEALEASAASAKVLDETAAMVEATTQSDKPRVIVIARR